MSARDILPTVLDGLRYLGVQRDVQSRAQDWTGWIAESHADLEPQDLQRAFRQLAQKRADGPPTYRAATVQDLLALLRQAAPETRGDEDGPPKDPICAYQCLGGLVTMRGADGYEVVVPCSCKAGWWMQSKRKAFWQARNANDAQAHGYEPMPPALLPGSVNEKQGRWINKVSSRYERAFDAAREGGASPQEAHAVAFVGIRSGHPPALPAIMAAAEAVKANKAREAREAG
jgi:hypothetical protein